MKKNVSLAILVLSLSFPMSAYAVNWEEFDTVAGIPETIVVDGLERFERRPVIFIFACEGGTFERQADVDGADAEVVLKSEDLQTAGVCSVRVMTDKNELITQGSFEIFADIPVQWELVPLAEEPFLLDEEAELKAGYFDKFRNPTSSRLVAVSGDGEVIRGQEDDEGYLYLTFMPDTAGMIEIKLIDTLTDESRAFTFEVKDPTPPPVAAAPASQNGADAVTMLLGQLIRASLLTEYGNTGTEGAVAEPDYGLVDSFDVQVGDSATTIRVNEQQDLTIAALDRRGRVVQNYVDRVMIETSDPDAVVPSGLVRFKATDRGRKILPLTMMFQTPGEQTITVRDEADPSEIFGVTKVWVLGHTSAPANRSIMIHEQPGTVAGRKVTISGTAPAYTNLDLYTVDDEGLEGTLATTSSDEEGTFAFQVTLDAARSTHTLFVRDPEDRAKDSARITVTVDAVAPIIRSPILTPATATPGIQVTVSVEAETGQKVSAELPGGSSVSLMEKHAGTEEGFSLYEGMLVAPAMPNQYPVTVKAADAAGNEEQTVSMLIVAAGVVGLPKVEGLSAEVMGQEVKLSWNATQGAERYRVYFGSSAANLEKFIDTKTAALSIRLTGLTPGQMTYFAVTGLGRAGEESAEKSQMVSAALRGSLFELTAHGTVNGAMLRWVALPGIDVDRYRIRYGVQPGSYSEERWITANQNQLQINDLINGVAYYISLSVLQKNGHILDDTVETSVTPGENGMPGMRLGINDPLPAGIGGPGVMISPLPGRSGEAHSVAPVHSVPRSGASPSLFLGMAGVIMACAVSMRIFRTLRAEREILALMSTSLRP